MGDLLLAGREQSLLRSQISVGVSTAPKRSCSNTVWMSSGLENEVGNPERSRTLQYTQCGWRLAQFESRLKSSFSPRFVKSTNRGVLISLEPNYLFRRIYSVSNTERNVLWVTMIRQKILSVLYAS